jgi:hypothetical protein
MIGKTLAHYEITGPIGKGGMGEIWKARDTRLDRIVAIKKVKAQHRERFKQEARSVAALNNHYICQIHDIGPEYIVLEYVEGKPLSSPLPEKEAVRLAIHELEHVERLDRQNHTRRASSRPRLIKVFRSLQDGRARGQKPVRLKCFTHVFGMKCYLCVRKGPFRAFKVYYGRSYPEIHSRGLLPYQLLRETICASKSVQVV